MRKIDGKYTENATRKSLRMFRRPILPELTKKKNNHGKRKTNLNSLKTRDKKKTPIVRVSNAGPSPRVPSSTGKHVDNRPDIIPPYYYCHSYASRSARVHLSRDPEGPRRRDTSPLPAQCVRINRLGLTLFPFLFSPPARSLEFIIHRSAPT